MTCGGQQQRENIIWLCIWPGLHAFFRFFAFFFYIWQTVHRAELSMAPKRKAPAGPGPAAGAAKKAKADGKAKGGRPPAAAQLAKEAPAAGTPAAERSIASLFGARVPGVAQATRHVCG